MASVTLESLNPILEVSFTLNAIVPAIYSDFGRALRTISEFLARSFQEVDQEFAFTERRKWLLKEYIYKASPGLQALRKMMFLPVILSVFGLIASFSARMASIVWPNTSMSTVLALAISSSLLLLCPGGAALYGILARWIEEAFVRENSKNEFLIKRLREAFLLFEKATLASEKIRSETAALEMLIKRSNEDLERISE